MIYKGLSLWRFYLRNVVQSSVTYSFLPIQICSYIYIYRTNRNSRTGSSHFENKSIILRNTRNSVLYFSSYKSPSNDGNCQKIKSWAPSNYDSTCGFILRDSWLMACRGSVMLRPQIIPHTSQNIFKQVWSNSSQKNKVSLNLPSGRQGPTTISTLDYKVWIFCSYCHLCEFKNCLSKFRHSHPLCQVTFAEIMMRMHPSSLGASDLERRFRYLSLYQYSLFLFSIVTLEVFLCAAASISNRSRHTAC